MMGLHRQATVSKISLSKAAAMSVHCMKKIVQLAKPSLARFESFFARQFRRAVVEKMHKFICERWTNIYHMLIHSENLASLIYLELVSE